MLAGILLRVTIRGWLLLHIWNLGISSTMERASVQIRNQLYLTFDLSGSDEKNLSVSTIIENLLSLELL